jgi:hypothetical protein
MESLYIRFILTPSPIQTHHPSSRTTIFGDITLSPIFLRQPQEHVHVCEQGKSRMKVLFMRSLSTPGLTLMGPALLITTMFCDLTLPPSLFTSISATALRTALGPITIESGVHTLSIDPWLGQNGRLVVQYGRIFDLFITPAPSSCSQRQSQRCSRDNWR